MKKIFLINDKFDLVIIALMLLFSTLSTLFPKYELGLLYIATGFLLIRMIRLHWPKKKTDN